MLAIGAVIGFLVLGALLLDEGEVVTLFTQEAGREHRTHMWIVEVDGREFVRANRPSARWLARLRANPAVGLRRSGAAHGAAEPYWAQPIDDQALRARVDAEILRKYRFADRTWGRFTDRTKAQLVELRPRGDSSAAPRRDPSVTTRPTEILSPSATPPAPAEGAPGRGSGASS